jgi:RimJ/RimL family protein N-acetyltransferase
MHLTDVYDVASDIVLYRLLKGRSKSVNISHREMPSWKKHTEFIASKPYSAWYLILESERPLKVYGSVYLTKQDEIGIFLFDEHQKKGYGPKAIKMLMDLQPRKKYLANISPENKSSKEMFKRMGFTHLQSTYELNV